MLQRQRTQASSSEDASAQQTSAYRWEKLSPAEFEQLQDLAACKWNILKIVSVETKHTTPSPPVLLDAASVPPFLSLSFTPFSFLPLPNLTWLETAVEREIRRKKRLHVWTNDRSYWPRLMHILSPSPIFPSISIPWLFIFDGRMDIPNNIDAGESFSFAESLCLFIFFAQEPSAKFRFDNGRVSNSQGWYCASPAFIFLLLSIDLGQANIVSMPAKKRES